MNSSKSTWNIFTSSNEINEETVLQIEMLSLHQFWPLSTPNLNSDSRYDKIQYVLNLIRLLQDFQNDYESFAEWILGTCNL